MKCERCSDGQRRSSLWRSRWRNTHCQDSICLGVLTTDTPAPGDTRWGLDTFLGEGCSGISGVEPRDADKHPTASPRWQWCQGCVLVLGRGTWFTPSGLQRFKFILIYKNKTGSLGRAQIIQKWIMYQVKVYLESCCPKINRVTAWGKPFQDTVSTCIKTLGQNGFLQTLYHSICVILFHNLVFHN